MILNERNKDIETKEANLDEIIRLGFIIFIDILFIIFLSFSSSSSIFPIYMALNLFIFPVLFYNFTKGVLACFFGIKENVFKLIFFSLVINIPFIIPLINYFKRGTINLGGFTGFENGSTILKLFFILDGIFLPILAFSYISGDKKKIENDSEEEPEDVGNSVEDEDQEDYERGNVYNSEYDDMENSGNTELNPDEYSFSDSDDVSEIKQNNIQELLDEKLNKKKKDVKQLIFDVNSNEKTNTLK